MQRIAQMALISALSFGCAKHPPAKPTSNATDDVHATYVKYQDRLRANFLDSGMVVSRNSVGVAEAIGDSLIWTGVALNGLDCDHRAEVEDALVRMVDDAGGGIYRHWTLKDKISLDGALGVYFGLATTLGKCPRTDWSPVIRKHRAFVVENGLRLNPVDSTTIPKDFDYVLDLLAYRLNVAEEPDIQRKGALETEVYLWALAVKAKKVSCFRAHLGFLTLRSLEAMGVLSSQARANFCHATDGMDLPLIDHWCARTDLKDWVANFQDNLWQYRHQRCGAWEYPDGEGLERPGLDLLVAMKAAYDL